MLDSGLKYLPPGVSGFRLATAFSFAAGLALHGTGAATTDVTAIPSATAEIANTLFMESPQQPRAAPSRSSAPYLSGGSGDRNSLRAAVARFCWALRPPRFCMAGKTTRRPTVAPGRTACRPAPSHGA